MYTFPPPDKRRPVLVLTRQQALAFLTRVTVGPLSTTVRGSPTEVVVDPVGRLRERSAVNLDSVTTVRAERLGPVLATLDESTMHAVEDALAFALGFHRRLRD